MKPQTIHFLLTSTALVLAGCSSIAPTKDGLVGTWRVDLRPTPGADAYYKEFVVTRVEGNVFEGTFYDTTIESGRLNSDWGEVHFAFTTRDGSGAYNTSGIWDGTGMRGTTHSLGRDFLSVWTAVREPQPAR